MSKNAPFYRSCMALAFALLSWMSASQVQAQTTAFTYQGRLTDAGSPADGLYDLRFKLFDTPTVDTGTQQGPTLTHPTVQVTNGVFTVSLDFGAGVFTGPPRYLEISVRPSGNPDPHIILGPRQPVNSAPYALRSNSAAAADSATTAASATNAAQLGGVAASQYVLTGDPRLSDARPPTAGSGNYIQNTASQQAASNFSISGDGTAGGTLSANAVNAQTQYNLFGDRVLAVTGQASTFVGLGAGAVTTGGGNAFFGTNAGLNNTTGSSNSFFGLTAGIFNTTGFANSFFGTSAGSANTTGNSNSFFGVEAGKLNTTGGSNSFFGISAGQQNTTGSENSFFGLAAGFINGAGIQNSFFGARAGRHNTGSNNAFFGHQAGHDNDTGSNNAFFGATAGLENTTGIQNSFFGRDAGRHNETGANNAFFGYQAGFDNTTGTFNVFVGTFAGNTNTTGDSNTLIGYNADVNTDNLSHATAIGADARVSSSNTIVLGRLTGQDDVVVPGNLVLEDLGNAGVTNLCRNASNQLSSCSSSLRYKTGIQPFSSGLDIVRRLRPITFNWKDGGSRDVGFGAEAVNEVEPLLTTRNDKGEIEGVKYGQLTTVLVNAVREQQQQIEQQDQQIQTQQAQIKKQQALIEGLKLVVCQSNPQAQICK